MTELLKILVVALSVPLLLESIPVLFLRNRKAWWKASVLCNVVTNPILNIIVILLSTVLPGGNVVSWIVLALEVAVVFFEAWLYGLMLGNTYKSCLLFSLIANGISFVAGSALNGLILMYW